MKALIIKTKLAFKVCFL